MNSLPAIGSAFPALALALGAFLWGCNAQEDIQWTESNNVLVTIDQDRLRIDNQRQDTIWTRQFGRRIRARILLVPPSVDRDGIPPGEEKVVPLQEIPLGDNEEEVIVSWWEAVTTDGERRASETRSLVVELP